MSLYRRHEQITAIIVMDGKAHAYAVAVNVSDAEINTEGNLAVHDGDMEAAGVRGEAVLRDNTAIRHI